MLERSFTMTDPIYFDTPEALRLGIVHGLEDRIICKDSDVHLVEPVHLRLRLRRLDVIGGQDRLDIANRPVLLQERLVKELAPLERAKMRTSSARSILNASSAPGLLHSSFNSSHAVNPLTAVECEKLVVSTVEHLGARTLVAGDVHSEGVAQSDRKPSLETLFQKPGLRRNSCPQV
jgi:hypothetical protein